MKLTTHGQEFIENTNHFTNPADGDNPEPFFSEETAGCLGLATMIAASWAILYFGWHIAPILWKAFFHGG